MREGQPRRLIAVLVVLAGGLTASVGLTSGPASAATCGPLPSCAAAGTLTVTAGALTLTSPATLTWAATLNGTVQSIADVVAADEQYTVSDLTGSGAGWHVTTTATTFTNGTHLLPTTGTFVTTGSVLSIADTVAPTATCTGTCTVPTNATTYPINFTTGGAAVNIFDAAAATGLGVMVIGGSAQANPVGWWVNVPPTAFSGAYTSTVTMAIVTAP